jgi:tetratricopeptide (TPR) repeat protein
VSAEKGRSLAVNKRKILESAQKHLQRGALDKALEDYQTLVKADPKDSNVRLKVGDLHLKLGRAQDAIDSYLRVAQQFTNEGFDAKAVALYKQITKLDEKRFEVHAQLGELYQRMGLTSEAMKAIQFAADGAHRAGDKDQALELLRRMAALDPSNTASRLKVAELLLAEGKTDDALAEYDEVVVELGRQNNSEEQIKVLERALVLAPSRVGTLRALTRAATEAGVGAKAEKAARALLAALPDDPAALELCGAAFECAGLADDAAGVFRNLAEKFRTRGDEDRARELIQRYGSGDAFGPGDSDPPVLEADPSDLELDPELDASLGLPDTGEFELGGESAPTVAKAPTTEAASLPAAQGPSAASEEGTSEVDPDADFDQLLAEASVFVRYGKNERAVEALRAALRVEPGNALALEKLGEALAAMGNRPHASSALTRAGAAFAEAGDASGLERVRALLAPLDAKAAAALAAPPARAPEPSAQEPDAHGDLDLDIEIDAGLDGETLEPVTSARAPQPSDDDFSGIEIDVSGDLVEPGSESPREAAEAVPTDDDGDFTFDIDDSPAVEPEPSAPPEPKSEPPAGAGASPARVEADYEEAEFYREQGLLEEARALYERVLGAVPDHADALRRLGEIAALREAGANAAAIPSEPAASEALSGDFELDPSEGDQPEAAAGEAQESALPKGPRAAVDKKPPARPAAPTREPALGAAPTPRTVSAPTSTSAPTVAAAESPEASLGAADFDLAAELSGTFGESAESARAASTAEGDGFAAVFAAFKAGVKREVGDGDHEAHYDLGIAYKEMGLFEDAIAELRVALGDGTRKLGCLHLMAACALELGRAADAIAHLSEALASGALPGEQEAALRLDLGRAYQASGDPTRARSEYESVRAIAPGFSNIDRLLADLDAEPADPVPAAAEPTEAFESFDDLIEDDPQVAAAPAPAAPKFESFAELVSDDAPGEPEASAPPYELEGSGTPAVGAQAESELSEEAPPPAPAKTPARTAESPPTAAAPPPDKPSVPAAPARRKKKISFV